MKFRDLFEFQVKPFSDYVSVAMAKESGAIPERFWGVFADTCLCGSDMMARLNEGSVTAVTCCDPGCYVKIGYQVAEIFSKYGFKGIGVQTCKKVVFSVLAKKGSVGLFDVLVDGLYFSELGESAEDEFSKAIDCIREARVSFGRFVSRLSYPFIGDKFEEVLEDVNDFQSLMDTMKREGGILSFFSSRGVKDLNAVFCFAFFADEIRRLCDEFAGSIVASCSEKVPICMTGRMNTSFGVLTKSDFLEKCNLLVLDDEGGKSFDIVSVEAVRKAAYVIVGADSVARNTSKFRLAMEIETSLKSSGKIDGDDKFLFSPDEFLQYLLKGGGSVG
jgi:hypothetical protein